MTLWDTVTRTKKGLIRGHQASVNDVAFAPDGRTLATAANDRTIRLWDVAAGRELTTLQGHTDDVTAVAFSPGGTRLASGSLDCTVKLWDTATGREVFSLDGPQGGVWCLGFSRDGNALAAGGAPNSRWPAAVYLWFASSEQKSDFTSSWKRPWWSTTPLAPPEYRGGMTRIVRIPLPPCTQGGRGVRHADRLMETRIRQGFSTNRETRFRIPRRRCV